MNAGKSEHAVSRHLNNRLTGKYQSHGNIHIRTLYVSNMTVNVRPRRLKKGREQDKYNTTFVLMSQNVERNSRNKILNECFNLQCNGIKNILEIRRFFSSAMQRHHEKKYKPRQICKKVNRSWPRIEAGLE